MKICHVTSGHYRNDIRVFLKEISSLRANGYETRFVVADGAGNDDHNLIYDVGKPKSRLGRFFGTTRHIYKLIKTFNDIQIFHFHDPELIPIACKMKRRGRKVIFDFHEDVPKQLLTKPYLSPFLLKILSGIFARYELKKAKRFDFIITTTQSSKNKFLKANKHVEVINNYPLPSEFIKNDPTRENNEKAICYVGGISRERGILELIEALGHVDDIKLKLAGNFKTSDVENEAKELKAWNKVNYYGYVTREETQKIYKESIAGIVTFLPTPHHMEAQSNKTYEYMAAGLPVIASNFPMWEKIINEEKCGICVNPEDPVSIADAIKYIAGHPEDALEMGKKGVHAAMNKYNWLVEEKKLLSIYRALEKS